MPPENIRMLGIFSREDQAASAIRGLRNTPFTLERVNGPIPSHVIAEALDLPRSRVGWFTLAGGIVGFFTGFLLAIFTASRWSMIVSGKPVIALVPFFIVGFEFTILFAVFGNVLGLISQARLPRYKIDNTYDPRFTGNRFGVLAACEIQRQAELKNFFEAKGAEVKTFAAVEAHTGNRIDEQQQPDPVTP